MSLLILLFVLVAGGLIALLIQQVAKRKELYRELAERRTRLLQRQAPLIRPLEDPQAIHEAFQRNHIAGIPGFLDPRSLAELQAECTASRGHAERSYIPGHKKGGTLSYEGIHRYAPACLALYHARELHRCLSAVVGEPLVPTADHDQSSCSILYYDQAGDHINWHYDHNFYRGRHFTVILSLVNRSDSGGISAGRLTARENNGRVIDWDTAANNLVIFEGAKVLHRATPIAAGDERVMLSMTLCTDPGIDPLKEVARRVKDTAYFGPRALVD